MSEVGRRKCRHCKELFYPDRRNRKRQKYCWSGECRQASRAASRQAWLSKPENQNYFRGREQVERVRCWRAANPGYWRREGVGTLQDVILSEAVEKTEESADFASGTLQDFITVQPLVIIGLIANLTGTALQDDIASACRKLLRLGQDIVAGANHGQEAGIGSGASSSHADTVQLGRSAAGP